MKKFTLPIFSVVIFFLIIIVSTSSLHAQSPYVAVTEGPSKPLPADYLGQNAANIIDNRSLEEHWLRTKIPFIHPATIRHVASSPSNWWDWRSGWLLTQENMLPGYQVRDDWAVLTPRPDKISDLKYLADTMGSSIMFVPNLLTSRLDYQVAAMFEFADKNLLAPYVEMGCEFYLDNNEASQRFPTSIEYADTVTKWIAGFRELFPNLRIAVIGATEQGNSVRRNTWTQNVVDHAVDYDAVSLHAYIPTGLNLPDSIIPKTSMADLFAKPFETMEPDGEVGKELTKIQAGDELWISEYNLTDQRYVINGHWAHGLFVAALTLNFLSDSRITHVNEFRMSGDAFHGNLFETDHGFSNGPAYIALDPDLHTNPNEFTATGNAMQLIGSALHLATNISPLIFTSYNGAVISQLSGGYSSLYGYKVTKPFSDEMILLNLSADSTLLNVQAILDSAVVSYETLWWASDTAKRPMIEITGDMPVASGTISNGEIYIPPYSIMRLYEKKNSIYAKATDDTICGGSSTTMLAYGGDQYSWSPAVTTTGDGAVAYASPANTTTYTVTATQGCNGPGCTQSITIHVVSKPLQGVIEVTPSNSVCPGTTVTLSVQQTDANEFCWTSPGIGSQFANSTVNVMPADTTTYYLFGAKDGCYSYRDSVTIYIRPSANAGQNAIVCTNDSLLIGTPAVADLTYSWSPASGLSNAYIARPKASPVTETSYVLTVTDPSAGCSDLDTIVVEPVQCCQSSGPTPVFPPNTTSSAFLDTMLNVYGANVNLNTRILKDYEDDIYINGTFIIDSGLSIINCPGIKFGEKARIWLTDPDLKLKFQNDSLQSCGSYKWSGIISTNILSRVIIDSCFVADADTVLFTKNDADYEIKNSYFHNNNCAVEMVNYVEELEGEIPEGTIYGTTFEGDYNFSTGINTEHVNLINIGASDKGQNIFQQMFSGINIQNGDATIVNNQFQFLQYGVVSLDTFTDPDFDPEYKVTVGGELIHESNSFVEVTNAITAEKTDLTVTKDTFNKCDYAVWAKNAVARSFHINMNYMTNVFKGINLVGNKNSDYKIKHNMIITSSTNENFFPVAINITDLSNESGISGSARITDNEIYTSGIYGILLSNNNGYGYNPDENSSPQITDNTIHLSYSGLTVNPVAGIRLESCINNAVGRNNVDGDFYGSYLLQGIQVFGVSGGHFFCNTFDTLGTGIVFIGTNKNDSTWGNFFIHADTCLKVGQTSILYGKLNDQSGNTTFTSGNQFQNPSDLHLAKLDAGSINYYTGTNETFPPGNIINFNIVPENLPVFTCQYSIGSDSDIQYLPDPCADTTASHATIQAIVEQYPVNGAALINDNEILLWQVANTCPLDCGEDVFTARALLRIKYDTLIFNDDSLCFNIPTGNIIMNTSRSFFSIYPNPASTQFTVQYSFADNGIQELKFSDLSGRIISSYQLSSLAGNVVINSAGVNEGCYFLSLFTNEHLIKVEKLIIAK